MTSQGAAVRSAPSGSAPGGAPSEGGQSPSDSERDLLSGPPSARTSGSVWGPWATTDALREFQPAWRVRDCGRWVAWQLPSVHIRLGESGWSFGHLHRCGSAWSCPSCANQISRQRAREVAQAAQWWRAQDESGKADVVLLTLTVRHRPGQDLRILRQGVSHAWRRIEQSRTWRKLRAVCGMSHHIRAQEVTWGDNGWHPHLHILLFCRNPNVPPEYFARNEVTGACSGMLVDDWRRMVEDALGKDCMPNRRRALDIERCDDATYIARMGLEVGGPAAKKAKDGHLTAMQLAKRIAEATGVERARLGALWREYAQAMHGAHQLHWSQGLKEAMGVPLPDGEVVRQAEQPNALTIAAIPKETWHDMACRMGVGPLDSLGKSKHGLSLSHQLAALLAFFQRLYPETRCYWRRFDGHVLLRWDVAGQ